MVELYTGITAVCSNSCTYTL